VDRASVARSMNGLARTYTNALAESLGDSLVSVVLFGSAARGEAGPVSDIDLLVVVDDLPSSRLARHEVLRRADERVEDELRRLRRQGVLTDIHPILKTPAEAERITPLYLDLVEDARILFDRDGFFARILERLRQSLRTLGARRIERGHLRYWDLKPDYHIGEVFEV